MQKESSQASDDNERVSQLEEAVRAANEKVTHYQTVLADTVSMQMDTGMSETRKSCRNGSNEVLDNFCFIP